MQMVSGTPTANGWPPERRCEEANVEPPSCFEQTATSADDNSWPTAMSHSAGGHRHRGRTKFMMLDAHEFIDLPPCSNLCIE